MSPKRTESHTIGDKAVKILERCLPDHWIFRDQGNSNDYGIDVEVELVGLDGEVTGIIFKGQVKGHKNINFKNNIFKRSMSTDKLKYWLRFSMPVFLFEVDIITEEIFWVDAQSVARKAFPLHTQNSKQIPIPFNSKLSPLDKIGTHKSLILIINKALNDYDWKTTYNVMKQYYLSLSSIIEVWHNCRYFDFFMEMDFDEYKVLNTYYQNTRRLAQTFNLAKSENIPLFSHFERMADEKWDGIFTYSVGSEVCKVMMIYLVEILGFVRELVMVIEEDFWREYDFEFQQEIKMFKLPNSVEDEELLSLFSTLIS